jgi:hypothetical protein
MQVLIPQAGPHTCCDKAAIGAHARLVVRNAGDELLAGERHCRRVGPQVKDLEHPILGNTAAKYQRDNGSHFCANCLVLLFKIIQNLTIKKQLLKWFEINVNKINNVIVVIVVVLLLLLLLLFFLLFASLGAHMSLR